MIRESWATQTECAECGRESGRDDYDYLTQGLCRGCFKAMGYDNPGEVTE